MSFETIEHVPDAAAFLAEMTRVLRPDGTFICSTPNIAHTAHPPCHLKEYRPEEFFALLERGYGIVERFGQYFKPIDRAQDLYQWHVRAPLVDAAARIGIKETLKKILGGAPPSPSANWAMARLTADAELRARLRARGLQRAAAFSWRRSARAHLALFQQALAGGKV